MSKVYSAEELRTFTSCSMQYHLRYRLGLPWFEASPGAAYTTVARRTVQAFTSTLMTTGSLQAAGKTASAAITLGVDRVNRAFRRIRRVSIDLRFWTLSIVRTLVVYLNENMEFCVGHSIPVEVEITVPHVETFWVSANLTAIFKMKDGTMVAHLQDSPPTLLSKPAWDAFELGATIAASAAIEERVEHLVLPEGPLVVKANDLRDFQLVASNAMRGIASGAAYPSANAYTCAHCPYRTVCTASLASSDVVDHRPKLLKALEREHSTNLFYTDAVKQTDWLDSITPKKPLAFDRNFEVGSTVLDRASNRPIVKVPPDPIDQPAYGSIPSQPGQGAVRGGGSPLPPDDVEVVGD